MVINLRTYYIFNINNYFSYIYKKKPYKLYKMIEEIYHTNNHDIVLSYKLFDIIALPFNKNKLNAYIKFNNSENISYYNKNNIHIIMNNNEYSKLVINNANLKIKTNINIPSFLNNIYQYKENLFVCDFNNKDYFWLEKVEENDCINKEYEVK